jgi:hypothetical protein
VACATPLPGQQGFPTPAVVGCLCLPLLTRETSRASATVGRAMRLVIHGSNRPHAMAEEAADALVESVSRCLGPLPSNRQLPPDSTRQDVRPTPFVTAPLLAVVWAIGFRESFFP